MLVTVTSGWSLTPLVARVGRPSAELGLPGEP